MIGMRVTLLAGVSLCACSTAAFAQQPATPQSQTEAGGEQENAPETASGRDIIVTGSRVITNGNNSPTPITVVTPESLAVTSPSNIPDGLRKLPVFGNSRSSSNIGNAGANNVGNFLNLRAFGVIRTLVLFNGHRVPATNADGTVDTNTLPQLLLKRVDVVTGGASAVYGSDAVTGVVNFVLDNKFNGVRAIAQGGISQYSDAGSHRLGVAVGQDLFGGRGHFEASYEHFQQDGIDDKFDRANGRRVYLEAGSGTAANPFHLIENARASTSSFGGLIRSGVLAGQNFYANGQLRPFVNGTPSGTTGIQSGGDGTYNVGTSITADLETHQAFARFDYELTDDLHFYVQGSGAYSANRNNFGPPTLANYTISADNAFLPADARAALLGAGQSTFTFSRTIISQPQYITGAKARNLTLTTGLDGQIGGFKWEAFYTYGRSRQRLTAYNNVNNGRLAAALDAVTDPATGQIVCRTSLTNPGVYPGCVPINLFGPTAESAQAYDYITGDTSFRLTNSVHDLGGSISGTLFDTWAGPVKVAISGEYRRITLDNKSNADPNVGPDCTGLRYNCSASTIMWLNNTRADVHASQGITEGAIEASVPLLRDVPFFQSLDLNGAYRFAHYSVSGNANTWKVGLDWHLNDSLSFRGTRSRDIRAPTLFDLFAPVTRSFSGYTDLHTGIAQGVYISTRGNPNLTPEVANTLTVGAVFKPAFLPGFSISLDYYRIRLNNAIVTLGGNSVPTQRLCEDSNGTSPLCAFYVRPLPFDDRSAANFPTNVTSGPFNAASTRTEGLDGEINYTSMIGDGLRLNLRGLVTYQPVLETQQLPGSPPVVAAGVAGQQAQAGVAKVRATAFVSFSTDHFDLDIQERWRSPLKQSGAANVVFSDPRVPSVAYTDLTFTFKPGTERKFNLFFSVQNLFNKKAPVYTSTNFASNPNYFYPAADGDDVIGRYFTSGVRATF